MKHRDNIGMFISTTLNAKHLSKQPNDDYRMLQGRKVEGCGEVYFY
ncbi:MAG: hypothetical protein NT007_15420 [Candidatus Kapabacteria bacterium]|nr:hypothetical protein [Candidatus Kapabacteria bacterium]